MKKLTRMVSMALAVLMVFTLLPAGALAALWENTPEYNREILTALEEVVGSEKEAEKYYSILEQYGLLDEEENEGKRTLELKLYNDSDAMLEGSGRTVRISFYTDSTLESPHPDIDPIIVSAGADLRMIDNGGFAVQTVFDAGSYLASLDGAPSEIPEAGIPVYIKAETLLSGEEYGDAYGADNTGYVLCENLEERTGSPETVRSTVLSKPEGSTVTAEVRNNRLTDRKTGNIIVIAYDENGEAIYKTQSFDEAGLITLSGEETKQVTFELPVQASRAEVLFTDAVLDDETDAGLAELTCTNIHGVNLDSFTEGDEGSFTASADGNGYENASFIVAPNDPEADVTLNGEPVDVSAAVTLTPGDNVLEFVVTARDGVTQQHYTLTIRVDDEKPGPRPDPIPIVPVTPEKKDGGKCAGGKDCPLREYKDLDPCQWYHDGIHYCLENGLMNGVGREKFSLDGVTTRAQIVTILWRLENEPYVNYAMSFDDVQPEKWYTEAIRWAAAEKIVTGYTSGSFGPDDPVTREQLAAILYRYAAYKGYGTECAADLSRFTNAESISSYAAPALRWAVGNGLMEGNAGKLTPKGNATRAQAATLLMRYCEKTGK